MRLNLEARADIEWWAVFASEWNWHIQYTSVCVCESVLLLLFSQRVALTQSAVVVLCLFVCFLFIYI